MATLVSVIMRGLYSALPSAGIAGRLYFCSDSSGTYEGAIYYDDGTNWDGPYGGSGGGGGASFEVNGTPLSSATTVNFENGSNVTITNPSAGNIEIAASGGSGSPSFFGLWNFAAPPTTGWTGDNFSGCTFDVSITPVAYMQVPAQSVANVLFTQYRSQPSTPYTITAAILHHLSAGPNTGTVQSGIGIAFRTSGGGYIWYGMGYPSSGNATNPFFAVFEFSSATSFGSSLLLDEGSYLTDIVTKNPVLLRIGNDGTNLTFQHSVDGLHWVTDYTNTISGLGFTPNAVAFGVFCGSGQITEASLISWG